MLSSHECVRDQPIVTRRQQCGEARWCANYFETSRESARENECTLIESSKNRHRSWWKLRCTLIQIPIGAGPIGDSGWSIRSWVRSCARSAHRHFIRRVGRKLARRIRLNGVVDRRRNLGPWIARRAFHRRFVRRAGRRRRNLFGIAHTWNLRHVAPSYPFGETTAGERRCSVADSISRPISPVLTAR